MGLGRLDYTYSLDYTRDVNDELRYAVVRDILQTEEVMVVWGDVHNILYGIFY